MSRIKFSPSGEGPFHGQSDPMAKGEGLLHHVSKFIGMLREGIKEKGSPWLDHPGAFRDPGLTPFQIFTLQESIRKSRSIILAKIKGGIGKDRIDHFILNMGEELQTIHLEKDAV
jgi:hypothetical protein